MSDKKKNILKTGNKLIDETDWNKVRKKFTPLGLSNIPKYKYVRFNDLVNQPTPPKIFNSQNSKTTEIIEKIYGIKTRKIDLKLIKDEE